MSELVHLELDDFTASASHDGSSITMRLSRNADHAAVEAFGDFLETIHAKAVELAVREVVIDIRTLEFMTSSCFKSLVYWITQIQELEPERRYTLRFVSSPTMHWQKRSLRTLACFATELVVVEAA